MAILPNTLNEIQGEGKSDKKKQSAISTQHSEGRDLSFKMIVILTPRNKPAFLRTRRILRALVIRRYESSGLRTG